MTQELITAILKVIFMLLFFAIVCIVGTLPIRLQVFKTNPKLRMMGSTFAGALFINVAILHILPQSSNTLQQYLKDGDDDLEVFPLANLLMMVGFLITIFFTKIMTTHEHLEDAHLQHSLLDHAHQGSTFQHDTIRTNQHQNDHKHSQEDHNNHKQTNQQSNSHEHCENDLKSNRDNVRTQTGPSESLISQQQIKQIKKIQKRKSALNQAYVLTIAIYFHTIFQGIAIGVQTKLSQFLGIAIAIAFHKWADALSMGCHYRAKSIPKKTGIYLILGQAVLNVLSIGLGWIIATQGDVLQAIFLSISAGTFLAISTMQLLSEQLHHRQYKYQKYGLLILSTIFISCIWFVQNRIF